MVTVRLPLQTTPERALAFATRILASHSFRVEPSPAGVRASGPGLHSSKQDPLRGVGRVSLVIADGGLEGSADLAGTRGLCLFAVAFPPALIGFLTVVSLMTGATSMLQLVLLVAGLLVPWLILGPLAAFWIRHRSEAAFRTFVANVAVAR